MRQMGAFTALRRREDNSRHLRVSTGSGLAANPGGWIYGDDAIPLCCCRCRVTERNPIPPCLSHLDAIARPEPKAWYVATQGGVAFPLIFRPGEPALILGVVMVRDRPCFRVRYADGFVDETPIENEDWRGKGGLGMFYEIRGEP